MSSFKEQIKKVTVEVLEESAYIFSDSVDNADLPDLKLWHAKGVEVNYSGHASGYLHVWSDAEFIKIFVLNILGMDESEEITSDIETDALKEFANMLVGNITTSLFGKEPVFDLGIPEVLDTTLLSKDINCDDAIWFLVDECYFMVLLREQN